MPLMSNARRQSALHAMLTRSRSAIVSHSYRLHHLQIGWALLTAGPSANAAADGVDGFSDLLLLLLLLAVPILILLLGLTLGRWAWKQKSAVEERPRTLGGDPARPSPSGSVATDLKAGEPIASQYSKTSSFPEWDRHFDRASLTFLALAYVVLPIGLLIDSVVRWLRQDPEAISFALGPGLFLCYLPVAVGLLYLSRRKEGLSTAGLMALATIWLLVALFTPLSVLQTDLATYRKLADPGPLDYLRLVLPFRHFQSMIAALVWLLALTLVRGGRR